MNTENLINFEKHGYKIFIDKKSQLVAVDKENIITIFDNQSFMKWLSKNKNE